MQRRLRFIFGLLAVCLLGSYGFQAYWLYGSYQVATAQVARTAHEALETVVQRQQLKRANKVFNIRFNDYAGPGDAPGTPRRWQIEQLDTGLTPAQAVRQPRPTARGARRGAKQAPPSDAARAARTDSLARQLSSFVISNWQGKQRVDMAQLARAYRAELRQRQVQLAFRLDTLAGPAGLAGFSLHTPAVQLNPVRETAVVASFRPPRAFVLGRLAGSLAGSALLLGLTTSCFALMLSTILRQKRLSEVKSDFINNMTHELKTPLATVSAAVEALQSFGALADAQRTATYLSLARQELHRLAELIDKVLHAAVAERPGHTLQLYPERLCPAELVAELVQRHKLQAAKDVYFTTYLSPTDILLADRLHLAGALDNLLDNAIKYAGAGVRIGLRSEVVAGGWQLTISDNGPGIAADYREAIFEQFFRVPTGNLHPVKGFGLGLYYVRQVVAAHGGRVHVRPAPGGGSAFVVWLPPSIVSYP